MEDRRRGRRGGRRRLPFVRRARAIVAEKLRRELDLFWAEFGDAFGDPGERPESYWKPSLGFFGIDADGIAVLRPDQILDADKTFFAMHGKKE